VVVGKRVAVGWRVAVGVRGSSVAVGIPRLSVAVGEGVTNRGAGVTVTAGGVAIFPGQQPATSAVARASAYVGGGAHPANVGMKNTNNVIRMSDFRMALPYDI